LKTEILAVHFQNLQRQLKGKATTYVATEEGKIFTINIRFPDNYQSFSSALTRCNEESQILPMKGQSRPE
jgi:rRNA pseudouridine-1189 N-methylase Emg1 (Nep1/Mra1 family)